MLERSRASVVGQDYKKSSLGFLFVLFGRIRTSTILDWPIAKGLTIRVDGAGKPVRSHLSPPRHLTAHLVPNDGRLVVTRGGLQIWSAGRSVCGFER